jgi:protein-S-isoprenylcysteine O-methyltransferase Ste14
MGIMGSLRTSLFFSFFSFGSLVAAKREERRLRRILSRQFDGRAALLIH